MPRRWPFLLALLCTLLCACHSAPPDAPAEVVQRQLVGTWLREYDEQGTHVRRILVLDAQGAFREASTAIGPGDLVARQSQGSGAWLFDGTNLKRHYSSVNGKPLSAPTVPFATFEIRFPSRSEFIGVDHVRKLELRYRRVAEGTLVAGAPSVTFMQVR